MYREISFSCLYSRYLCYALLLFFVFYHCCGFQLYFFTKLMMPPLLKTFVFLVVSLVFVVLFYFVCLYVCLSSLLLSLFRCSLFVRLVSLFLIVILRVSVFVVVVAVVYVVVNYVLSVYVVCWAVGVACLIVHVGYVLFTL